MNFDEMKIKAVEEWQEDDTTHPLTCAKEGCDSNLEAKEDGGRVVLECPKCHYVQSWIPTAVLSRYQNNLKKSKK